MIFRLAQPMTVLWLNVADFSANGNPEPLPTGRRGERGGEAGGEGHEKKPCWGEMEGKMYCFSTSKTGRYSSS
ncbi:MAG: hypothetical protein LBN38_08870 [Verrucomicrobiota bacterium]|jgi:hypothetical protein|nr:hypothetical protein [Verrucomicrobiota bacterium]